MSMPPSKPPGPALVKLAKTDIRAVPSQAGGLGAVTSTMRFLHRDTGLWRGGKLMLQINQADGFDCPGCAWPEASASERHHLEFCENGAKAVAEEATKRRATPQVLSSHDLTSLRAMTDFELGQLGRITHPMMIRDDGTGSPRYQEISWAEAIGQMADAHCIHRVAPAMKLRFCIN
jgi:anaerobic selenocysteine-containing dehydrogenase